MAGREVVVIRTGTANTASVLAGLRRVDARVRISNDPDHVACADFLVLPGVGALASAVERLEADGLRQSLIERIAGERPTLAVCLGMQLLCAGSTESPGVAGLGILPATVERFDDSAVVPQMGWNRVEPDDACRLLRPGWAYFANSYRLVQPPSGWAVALSDHAGSFVSALERGPILACQFHPELSGAWGLALLRRWLAPEKTGGGSC